MGGVGGLKALPSKKYCAEVGDTLRERVRKGLLFSTGMRTDRLIRYLRCW